MTDAHCLVVRKVDWKPAGDLLWAPGICPSSRLPSPVSTPLPGHRWTEHMPPAGSNDCSSQPLLHVVRNAALSVSLPAFGLRADRSACHCAVVARYSRPPLRVAALRRNSREIVDAARPSLR